MIFEKIKKEIDGWLKNNQLEDVNYNIEKSNNNDYGDISTNVALVCSKKIKKNPMDVANEIAKIFKNDYFSEINVSKPGFINFKIGKDSANELLRAILKEKGDFGKFPRKNKKYSVEYVSANPTGLLHIGHARNGVLGNCIINLLEWYGFDTVSEYIINDAGNQMNNLASAILIRYQQLFGKKVELPEDSYHGNEIIDVAKKLKEEYGDKFLEVKLDENNHISDKEIRSTIRWFGRDFFMDEIKKDLKSLGIVIEKYFSEYTLHENKMVDKLMEKLVDQKVAYKKDGALWLETTKFGDDKDRVLVKSDGSFTYFAPDIVYHNYKWTTNGTNYLINIWGADHYSYVSRMKIAMKCLGYNPDDLIVICMQMVKLTKNGEQFKMSKRTGDSLTTRDLVEALGKDIARWYLISQSANNHLIIDVEEATTKSMKNPLYYVQYAHARANSLLEKEKNISEPVNFNDLTSNIEREIMTELELFKYTIQNCALTYEPYKMTVYLLNLSKLFHSYYSNTKILDEDNKNKQQQYYLVKAIKQVIANGLEILGIKASDKM